MRGTPEAAAQQATPFSPLTSENVGKLQQEEPRRTPVSGITTASTFSSSHPSDLRNTSPLQSLPAAVVGLGSEQYAAHKQAVVDTGDSFSLSSSISIGREARPAQPVQPPGQRLSGWNNPSPQIVGPYGGPLGAAVPVLTGSAPSGVPLHYRSSLRLCTPQSRTRVSTAPARQPGGHAM